MSNLFVVFVRRRPLCPMSQQQAMLNPSLRFANPRYRQWMWRLMMLNLLAEFVKRRNRLRMRRRRLPPKVLNRPMEDLSVMFAKRRRQWTERWMMLNRSVMLAWRLLIRL
jgi:hypothetical protein